MNETEKFFKKDFFNLESNKKYIVTDRYNLVYYVGIFDHYQKEGPPYVDLACFKELIEINPLEKDNYIFVDLMKDKSLPYEIIRHDANFSTCARAYVSRTYETTNVFYDLEIIKEKGKKAREKMERRSVNMIIRQIIGDPNFEW